jgi:hypothetical protein
MESHWLFIKCARALADAGIASLRFDFYGSGESEGEFREVTLRGEMADAADAADFFRKQKGVDGSRLGLVGLSLGGCVAASVAPRVRARALVLWSAVAHPRILRAIAATSGKPLPGGRSVEYDAREVTVRFLEDAASVQPLKAIRRFKGPTLVLHAGKDESVPVTHAQDYFAAAGARQKEKILMAAADHTFTSLAWEGEVIRRTVEWFRTYLPDDM